MEASTATRLGSARAAYDARQWAVARDGFRAVLDNEPDCPEAVAGLGDALWWLGETDAAIRCCERAYGLFRRHGDPVQAALRTIPLYLHHRVSLGNVAVARGWLGRLARLVEDFDLAPIAGWVAVLRAHDTADPVQAERWAREAMAAARGGGAPDLELCAVSECGASLVQQGRVEEGTGLLDEAMAGAIAGECDRPETVVFTSCNLVSACWQVADLTRLAQWIRAADTFADARGAPHLYTHCRVHHGAARFLAGDWAQAERELTTALQGGRSADPALHGEALGWLARLRIAQGRPEEAVRLLEGYEHHAASIIPLAAARLAAGDATTAVHLLRARVREVEADDADRVRTHHAGAAVPAERAELLDLLVEADLAAGLVPEGESDSGRLAAQGAATPLPVVVARAHRAYGRVCGVRGDDVACRALLQRAHTAFTKLGLVHEAARTWLELARATASADPDEAVVMGRAALAELERLGAAETDGAASLLRDLGEPAAVPSRSRDGVLTAREQEVLRLLAEGLSNRELAQRLYLSRKTVEHHVHSVLTKLGLRSRGEATAYAIRHLEGK